MDRIKAAIIGPGNIGTDLIYKIQNRSRFLELAMVMSRHYSENLKRAESMGYPVTTDIQDILCDPDIRIVFDATKASAHAEIAPLLKQAGKKAIDLTPAAVGPYVCPAVNMGEHLESDNVNLITCGGQATIPIVAAVASVCRVKYAEIVACLARDSAGMGTRESIDEFTITTADGLRVIGGAERAKAIILLNPARPPMIMNNTIYCLTEGAQEQAVREAVDRMVRRVQSYVPGYRLKIPPQFDGEKITVMVEVEGAGDYLPKYSGNLDLETSAALAVGEQIAENLLKEGGQTDGQKD